MVCRLCKWPFDLCKKNALVWFIAGLWYSSIHHHPHKLACLWHLTYFSLTFGCLFPFCFSILSIHYLYYCWPSLPLDLAWWFPCMQMSSFINPWDVTLNTFSPQYFLSSYPIRSYIQDIHTLVCSFLSHLFYPAFSPFCSISVIHLQLFYIDYTTLCHAEQSWCLTSFSYVSLS